MLHSKYDTDSKVLKIIVEYFRFQTYHCFEGCKGGMIEYFVDEFAGKLLDLPFRRGGSFEFLLDDESLDVLEIQLHLTWKILCQLFCPYLLRHVRNELVQMSCTKHTVSVIYSEKYGTV